MSNAVGITQDKSDIPKPDKPHAISTRHKKAPIAFIIGA